MEINRHCPVCRLHDETVPHIFLYCNFAQQVWQARGFHNFRLAGDSFKNWLADMLNVCLVEEKESMVFTLWALWKAHNEVVWKNKTWSMMQVVKMCESMAAQWLVACSQKDFPKLGTLCFSEGGFRLSKPPVGSLKVNCDAALFKSHGVTSLAWVIRDHEGQFVNAISRLVPGLIDSTVAEAMSVREALSWLKEHDLTHIKLEIDTLLVVQAINRNDAGSSPLCLILDDCIALSDQIHDLSISHVRRSANRVAHYIAKADVSKPDLFIWGYSPQTISFLVSQDII